MNHFSNAVLLRGGFIAVAALLFALWSPTVEPTAADAAPDPDERVVRQLRQPVGRLNFEIVEAVSNIHLPARLHFAYADGRAEVPVVGRFQNYLVTATGREEKVLPAGEYEVSISRGTEYSLDLQRIRIEADQTTYLDSTLTPVIDTTGYISADFHLHLTFALRDGAIVTAAEGVDLLTATDHNILKDYAPSIRELGLERFLATAIGAEIDTAFGHFNSFPLRGNPWKDRSYRHAIGTPAEFFRLLRAGPGEEIIQVNHPRRWQPTPANGYFNGRLNEATGGYDYAELDDSFDQFEVFNMITDQIDGHIGRTALVDQKLLDWYRFLNRGALVTGVANTDAHGYPRHVPGYPRNYVRSLTDRPQDISADEVVTMLKARAVTTASGPFVRLSGDGAPEGSLIPDHDGAVTLRIEVQSPQWVPVETLEVVANGEVLRTIRLPELPTEPDKALRIVEEMVVQPKKDTWYLVIASSEKRWMKPFDAYSSFSFTNPVFVDANHNGYFDPPNGPGTSAAASTDRRGGARTTD